MPLFQTSVATGLTDKIVKGVVDYFDAKTDKDMRDRLISVEQSSSSDYREVVDDLWICAGRHIRRNSRSYCAAIVSLPGQQDEHPLPRPPFQLDTWLRQQLKKPQAAIDGLGFFCVSGGKRLSRHFLAILCPKN